MAAPNSSVHAIDAETVHRICSGQVITSVASAVKELVENALDSGARLIEVKFTNYGLEAIEVVDDGSGIDPENYSVVAQKHYTSKLGSFAELDHVSTFGFRGEALSSLCALAHVEITTCLPSEAPRGQQLEFDRAGNVAAIRPTSTKRGTMVRATGLFSALPVRRHELERNIKREFAKALTLLQAYAISSSRVRFIVTNHAGKSRERAVQMQTRGGAASTTQAVADVFGGKVASELRPVTMQFALDGRGDPEVVRVEGHISNPHSMTTRAASGDRQMVFVNGRPVTAPKIARALLDTFRQYSFNQSPFFCINIELPAASFDVNVSPDKRTIFIHHEGAIVERIREELPRLFDSMKFAKVDLAVRSTGESEPATRDDGSGSRSYSTVAKREEGPRRHPSHVADPGRMRETLRGTFGAGVASAGGFSEGETERKRRDRTVVKEAETEEGDWRETQMKDRGEGILDGQEMGEETMGVREKRGEWTEPGEIELEKEGEKEERVEREAEAEVEDGIVLEIERGDGVESGRDLDKAEAEGMQEADREVASVESTTEETALKKTISAADADTRLNYELQEIQVDKLARSDSNDPQTNEASTRPNKKIKRSPITESHVNATGMPRAPDAMHSLYKSRSTIDVDITAISRRQHCLSQARISAATNPAPIVMDVGDKDAEAALTMNITKDMFGMMHVVGQFNLGFILVTLRQDRGDETSDELLIIDQHASDEKYNFERLKATTKIDSQTLVTPKAIELSTVEELVAIDNIDKIRRNGFELEFNSSKPAGQRCRILAQPLSKNIVFDHQDLHELIQLLDEYPHANVQCSKVDKMFAMRACRSSIMIGKPLSLTTMRTVVRHLGTLDKPWNCPHGRPTMRHLANLNAIPLWHKAALYG